MATAHQGLFQSTIRRTDVNGKSVVISPDVPHGVERAETLLRERIRDSQFDYEAVWTFPSPDLVQLDLTVMVRGVRASTTRQLNAAMLTDEGKTDAELWRAVDQVLSQTSKS